MIILTEEVSTSSIHQRSGGKRIRRTPRLNEITNGFDCSEGEEISAYCVIQRYGKNLDYCLQSRNYLISRESVFNLGLQILCILEQIHNSGYIYNDLKLDNILLGFGQKLPADCSFGNCF